MVALRHELGDGVQRSCYTCQFTARTFSGACARSFWVKVRKVRKSCLIVPLPSVKVHQTRCPCSASGPQYSFNRKWTARMLQSCHYYYRIRCGNHWNVVLMCSLGLCRILGGGMFSVCFLDVWCWNFILYQLLDILGVFQEDHPIWWKVFCETNTEECGEDEIIAFVFG